MASVVPRLKVIRQNCTAEEKVSRNGQPKIAHVVIKNSPFMVVIGQEATAGSVPFDFNGFAVECTLLYDAEPTKMVDFVRSKPVEYKATAVERGTMLQIEMRIKVLTSQHEDMLFRVHVQVTDAESKQPIPGLAVRTESIKVISKPEQLKRRRPQTIHSEHEHAEPRPKTPARRSAAPPPPPPPQLQSQPLPSQQQRNVTVVPLGNSAAVKSALPPPPPSPLSQLPQLQPAQLPPQLYSLPRLGDILCPGTADDPKQDQQLSSSPTTPSSQQALPSVAQIADVGSPSDLTDPLGMPPATPAPQQTTTTQGRTLVDLFADTLTRIEQRQLLQQHLLEEVHTASSMPKGLPISTWSNATSSADKAAEFDAAFATMMDAYGRLGPTERAANVRRVVQLATPTQASQVSEIVDMFATEGLGRELGREARPPRSFTPTQQQQQQTGFGCDDMSGLDMLGSGFPSYVPSAM